MAEINRIKSFKTFSEVRANEAAAKLAEENANKRSELTAKIAAILDDMNITSFENLEEDVRKELITRAFGEVSEEAHEEEMSESEDVVVEKDDVATHLDRLSDLVGAAGSLMSVGKELKKAKYKYDFSTSMIPMYTIDADGHRFAIVNKSYVDKGDREVGDIAIGLLEAINEAVIPTDKRGAKAVFKYYTKFFQMYPALVGYTRQQHLGSVKQLFLEAMIDANFSREAYPCAKKIKGSISPIEIKAAELNNAVVKVPASRISKILDDASSGVSGAAKWSGLAIVEGTALYLESLKEPKMAEAVIACFNENSPFEGYETNLTDEEINERNAFLAARAKAIEEDAEEFEFNGKKYPVILNESQLNEGEREEQWAMEIYTAAVGPKGEHSEDELAKSGRDTFEEIVAAAGYKGSRGKKITDELMRIATESIETVEGSELNEAGANDPVMIAFRAAKMQREKELAKPKRKPLYGKQRKAAERDLWKISQDLKEIYAERGQTLIDMEQEAEIEGGPIADEYGSRLESMEAEIQRLLSRRSQLELKLAESFEQVFEATVEMDAMDPDNKEFVKFLKKNKVKIISKEEGPNGHPVIVMQGKRKDLETVLADEELGWADADLAEYIEESVINESEINSDEEFKEYAETVLQKAFGEDYDEAKAKEVIDGILSKVDGDYGAAVGMLTSSLG